MSCHSSLPPRPTSRSRIANSAGWTANAAAVRSARLIGGRSGSRSGKQLTCAHPEISSAVEPKPGFRERGPACPYSTSGRRSAPRSPRGATRARSLTAPRFRAGSSRKRGRLRRRSVRSAAPSSSLRSSVTQRLSRPIDFYHSEVSVASSSKSGHSRMGSPCWGCSTITTLAPKSASCAVANRRRSSRSNR